jgi:hypothetical protein
MKSLITGVVVCSLFAGSPGERPHLIFAEGAEFTFSGKVTIEGGEDLRYITNVKVNEVTRNGISVSSNATMVFSFDRGSVSEPYYCEFACDTTNFYVPAANYSYRTIDEVKEGTHVATGDSLIYPLKMIVGDTLPDAWYKAVRSIKNGSSTTVVNYTDRKVEALDTLDLRCGKVPAYRITVTKTTHSKGNSSYTGKYDKKVNETEVEWFSIKFGVVKLEGTSGKGRDVTQLEGYK